MNKCSNRTNKGVTIYPLTVARFRAEPRRKNRPVGWPGKTLFLINKLVYIYVNGNNNSYNFCHLLSEQSVPFNRSPSTMEDFQRGAQKADPALGGEAEKVIFTK